MSQSAEVSQQSFPKVKDIYNLQANHLQKWKNLGSKERIKEILKIKTFLENEKNEQMLCDALLKDFGKPKAETILTEIVPTLSHVKEIKQNLSSWMKNKSHSIPWVYTGLKAQSVFEPKGQALVIAPWNYPFFLAIYPVMYAIAAGCSVILKPSELTPHTADFLEKMLTELYPVEQVAVFQGGIPITTNLLEKKWGHIFFTGSPKVGKIVMKAAAKTLSSVSLELGGKSPCIVDESADVKKLVPKLSWGKFVNGGQTCIAPDYVLVHESKEKELVSQLKQHIKSVYGESFEKSNDIASIVNKDNAERLSQMIEDAIQKGGKIEIGGVSKLDSQYISPTIVSQVNSDMEIMQEEIFGPILPIMVYNSNEEVINQINSLEKPLSMYICSNNSKNTDYFINHSSAGGTLVNEFLLGAAIPSVPFGGVNNSGIGKAFGIHGFKEFSNERPVIKRKFLKLNFIYPPYTDKVMKILKWLKKFV